MTTAPTPTHPHTPSSSTNVHKDILKRLKDIELKEKQQKQALREEIGAEMTRRAQTKLATAKQTMKKEHLDVAERLARLYQALLDEIKLNRSLDTECAMEKRANTDLEKRNVQLSDQITRLNQQKHSLQQLCDAMHKQNKQIEELHAKMWKEEQAARDTMREQMETKVNGIADSIKKKYEDSMAAVMEENDALRKDREVLLDRLKKMDDLREALEGKTIAERKLAETQLQRQNEEHKTFTEKLTELKENLLAELTKARSEKEIYAARASEYAERYSELEKHVSGHGKLVEQYKSLVEVVKKNNEKLMKENNSLRRKNEMSSGNLSNMKAVAQKAVALQTENETLKKLCNAQQAKLKAINSATDSSSNAADGRNDVDDDISTLATNERSETTSPSVDVATEEGDTAAKISDEDQDASVPDSSN